MEWKGILARGKAKMKVLEARNKNFIKKSVHSQFMKKTSEVRGQETCNRLKPGTLKKETEEILTGA